MWSHLNCAIKAKSVVISYLHEETFKMDTFYTPICFIIIHCLSMRSGKPPQSGCLHQGLRLSLDYVKLTIFYF